MGKVALYIGRFQPFHNGHLSVVKEINETADVEKILIGIGSADAANTEHNPFSFAEREKMVKAALADIKKPFEIFPIQDVGNDDKWIKLVNLLVPSEYQIVYTNNDWVGDLFKKQGIEVRNPSITFEISATVIRKLIKDEEKWEQWVHAGTAEALKDIKGEERIRSLV